MYPHFAAKPNFAYDAEGTFFGNDKTYSIPTEYRWLTALLNSKLLEFQFKLTAPAVMGNFYEHRVIYLETLRIIQPDPQKQAILESITDDSRITELNTVVYQMYGLIPEEIALVETHTAGVVVGAETDLDEE
jgi:hypothetical protein